MPRPFNLPFRQIHLDFHTGPRIDDVGRDFDAREFARTMKRAHVNSVTVFAKCHHGHLYYNTARPERHPGLKSGLNLVGEQVEALHREGIRAPIYISVQCDEYAADHHPEWIARQSDGKPVGAGPLEPGWQIMDMSTPYQEYLAEQTREVLKLFAPVDGIFYDMCWDQPSLNNFFVDAMVRANLRPDSEADRKTYAHQLAHQYMDRFNKMVKAASPNATVYWNGRRYDDLREEAKFQTQVEIESLPTGAWGYIYFPRHVRNAYNYFPQPYMGMTARFHKSWADFGGIKPYAALEYETSQMIAHGARCSIGDQLHPRGVLEGPAYDLIGKAYARVEAREPWLTDAAPLSQIGVFPSHAPDANVDRHAEGTPEGVTRLLGQLKHQFRFIDLDAKLDGYELLILPDSVAVDARLAARLGAYVKRGGALLITGNSGLNADATATTLPILPIKPAGTSPFTTTYIRFGGKISDGVEPMDHVMYEPGVRVTPAGGATSLASVVEPYFQRSWEHFSSHFQTAPDKPGRFSAAVLKGKVAFIAYPIFRAYAHHANLPYRQLVRNIIAKLIDQPLLSVEAPSSMEATVLRQKNRTIVHLLYYVPERRTATLDLVEEIVPLHDVALSLKLAKAPKKVYLAPENQAVDFKFASGRVNLTVPQVRGHAMVVFE